MPLMPKRTKHRKVQKGRMRGKATRGNKVTDGEYGIQAVTGALEKSKELADEKLKKLTGGMKIPGLTD